MFVSMAESSARLPLPQAFPRGRVVLTVGRWAASERYKGLDDLNPSNCDTAGRAFQACIWWLLDKATIFPDFTSSRLTAALLIASIFSIVSQARN